jgi:DNA-directed RNA polymerase sigma subunit (sigma70/sigma32)
VVYVPKDLVKTFNKILVARYQETRETGREPTLEETAQKLAIPLEEARRVMEIVNACTTVVLPGE